MKRYLIMSVALTVCACAPNNEPAPERTEPAENRRSAAPHEAPDAANATIAGIYNTPVILVDGKYEGEPFSADSPIRPTVYLIPSLTLTGDLDADGETETAAFVVENSGGTGRFHYVTVLDRRDGTITNTDPASIGDRIDVRDAQIEGDTIVLDIVQAGPGDGACCPTELARRSWKLIDGTLQEQEAVIEGTLSLAALYGTAWKLNRFGFDGEPIEDAGATLHISAEGISGFGGCNQYSGSIAQGETAHEIEVGPLAATKRMCPDPAMSIETKFMAALSGATRFQFFTRSLLIYFQLDGEYGQMFLDPLPADEAD